MMDELYLEIPNPSHEAAYCRMMDRWEALDENIQPELMRRYSSKLGANVTYERFLAWCEDDRTTGSMLYTKIPCSLHFLVSPAGEILGSIAINHADTRRGHLHAGIAPWQRGKGCGTKMLELALNKCAEMGIEQVHIVPRKDNLGAIQAILRNGGVLLEEFYDDDICLQRYEIDNNIGEIN